MMSFFRLIMFRQNFLLLMYLVQLERDHGFSNLHIFGSYRHRDSCQTLEALLRETQRAAGDVF